MTGSDSEQSTGTVATGVIGVGSMGRHHARVYRELPGARLVGIADADPDRASEVAGKYDTAAMSRAELLDEVDAVSVAVPTEYHFPIANEAIERGVHTLVEKPLVDRPEKGRALVDRARKRGVSLQVGHVERFNPAVRTLLEDVVADLDVIAVDAKRLGPPLDRTVEDGVVHDLMIHDIDVVLAMVDDEVAAVDAGRAPDDPYVTASVTFENGVFGTLTASRVTQQKVRELTITARSCLVHVDYIEQSIRIHRHSLPEYVEADGDVRYRHESITERPTVDNGEPLRHELSAFLDAAATGSTPEVTGEDGLRALELARRIEREADRITERPPGVGAS